MSRETMPGQHKLPLLGTVACAVVSALLASVWFVGPPAGAAAALENRPMAEFPVLDSASIGDAATYAQLELGAKDRVRLKPVVVEQLNNLTERVTGVTASTLVIYGQPLNAARPQEAFSASEFTNRCWRRPEIQAFRNVLDRVRDAANQGGKKVIFLIAPSKYKTLGYLLGSRLDNLQACAVADDAVIHQLAQEYPDLLVEVDPQRVLDFAPKDPYWVGDSHWTPSGAKAITEQIIKFVGNANDKKARSVMNERLMTGGVRMAGGLYRMAGVNKRTPSALVKTRTSFPVSAYHPTKLKVARLTYGWKSERPLLSADKSMVIIHDSFINVPSVTRQFSSIVRRGYDVHWKNVSDLAKIHVAQTVVVENVDRTFLRRLVGASGLEDLDGQVDAIDALVAYLARTK